jgi:hypothetical protein
MFQGTTLILNGENEKLMLNIGPGIHLKVKEYSK